VVEWLVVGGWWLVVGGWWLVGGGWLGECKKLPRVGELLRVWCRKG